MSLFLPRIHANGAEKAEAFFCHGFTRMNTDRAKGIGRFSLRRSDREYESTPVEIPKSCPGQIRVHPRKSVAKKSSSPIRANPRPIRANPWQKNSEAPR